jgi:hypothetical protein
MYFCQPKVQYFLNTPCMCNEVNKTIQFGRLSVLVLLMGLIQEVHCWAGHRWHDMHTKIHEYWFGHSNNIKVITSTIWQVAVLVLLMGRIYVVYGWDDLRWQDTYIPSLMTIGSGIRVIPRALSTVSEAIVLVLLMRWIYDVCHWDGLRWQDICIPSFMKVGTGIQAILRVCLLNVRGCNIGIIFGRDLWCMLLKWLNLALYVYLPSFVKIGTGIKVILRFCLSNLNGCHVGITDRSDLWSAPLRWAQMTNFQLDWYRHWSNIKVLPQQFKGCKVKVKLFLYQAVEAHRVVRQQAIMSVLLKGGIYCVHRWNGLRSMIYILSSMMIGPDI